MLDQKSAVVSDCEIILRVIAESLVVSGYRVHEKSLKLSRGYGRAWIVEIKMEIER